MAFTYNGKPLYRNAAGAVVAFDPADAQIAREGGLVPASEAEADAFIAGENAAAAKAAEAVEYDSPIRAGALGLLRGATFGGSDWLARAVGKADEVRKIAEHNPAASFVGELGSLFVPGSGAKLLTKAGAGLASKIVAKEGASLGARALAAGGRAAVSAGEGVAFGAGSAVSGAALHGDDWAEFSKRLRTTAAFGAMAGGATHLAGAMLGGIGKGIKGKIDGVKKAKEAERVAAAEAAKEADRVVYKDTLDELTGKMDDARTAGTREASALAAEMEGRAAVRDAIEKDWQTLHANPDALAELERISKLKDAIRDAAAAKAVRNTPEIVPGAGSGRWDAETMSARFEEATGIGAPVKLKKKLSKAEKAQASIDEIMGVRTPPPAAKTKPDWKAQIRAAEEEIQARRVRLGEVLGPNSKGVGWDELQRIRGNVATGDAARLRRLQELDEAGFKPAALDETDDLLLKDVATYYRNPQTFDLLDEYNRLRSAASTSPAAAARVRDLRAQLNDLPTVSGTPLPKILDEISERVETAAKALDRFKTRSGIPASLLEEAVQKNAEAMSGIQQRLFARYVGDTVGVVKRTVEPPNPMLGPVNQLVGAGIPGMRWASFALQGLSSYGAPLAKKIGSAVVTAAKATPPVAGAAAAWSVSGDDLDTMRAELDRMQPEAAEATLRAGLVPELRRAGVDERDIEDIIRINVAGLAILKEKMPRPPSGPGQAEGAKWTPPVAVKERFARTLRAVADPEAAAGRMFAGKGSSEDREVLERLHPELLKQAQTLTEFWGGAGKRPLPPATRKAVSQIRGDKYKAAHIRALQQAYTKPEKAPAMPRRQLKSVQGWASATDSLATNLR